MDVKSQVFHLEGVRQQIFGEKCASTWGMVHAARNSVTKRLSKVKYQISDVEDQLHVSNPHDWRETAALLGQYWALRQDA